MPITPKRNSRKALKIIAGYSPVKPKKINTLLLLSLLLFEFINLLELKRLLHHLQNCLHMTVL